MYPPEIKVFANSLFGVHHLPIVCRNVQYNRECLETGKPVEYEELAILKDGLQVTARNQS